MVSLYQTNADIRKAKGKIPLWALADKCDVHLQTMKNWFRNQDLSIEKRLKILAAINEIKEDLKKKGLNPENGFRTGVK